MISRFANWLNEVNTTSFRIVASVVGAVVNITAIQVALLSGWEPTAMQLKVLTGEAGVLLTMMGFDVLQFIGKRFSDEKYQAARGPKIAVEQAEVVTAGGGAPTTVGSPASASSAAVAPPVVISRDSERGAE